MVYNSKETENYAHKAGNINDAIGEISIDDIDENAPIDVEGVHTVKNIFDGLNKIIKAIKTKLTSDDNRLTALETVIKDSKRIIEPASGQNWDVSSGNVVARNGEAVSGTIKIPLQGKRNCWFKFKLNTYRSADNESPATRYTEIQTDGKYYWCYGTDNYVIPISTTESNIKLTSSFPSIRIGYNYSHSSYANRSTTATLNVAFSNFHYDSQNDCLSVKYELVGSVTTTGTGALTSAVIPRDEIYFDVVYTLY